MGTGLGLLEYWSLLNLSQILLDVVLIELVYWLEEYKYIMTTKIYPPSLEKAKTYEGFKQEVLAWKEITDLQKNEQGIAVALSLPVDDEHQIKDKVFDQIPLDDLKTDFGLNVLIAFLDKHLAKDDLADTVEKFDDFDDFRTEDGQSINEYIATFNAKYRKKIEI